MKRIVAFAATLVVAGTLTGKAMAEDGLVVKEPTDAPGANYCHIKFSAMDENTLTSNQPRLKPVAFGDVIDFYGTCDESPTGKDQVQEQKLEESVLRSLDFDD